MYTTHIRNILGLGITILVLATAGCASDTMSAAAGGTIGSPTVDAAPARAHYSGSVAARFDPQVTGRDWNCAKCYK